MIIGLVDPEGWVACVVVGVGFTGVVVVEMVAVGVDVGTVVLGGGVVIGVAGAVGPIKWRAAPATALIATRIITTNSKFLKFRHPIFQSSALHINHII